MTDELLDVLDSEMHVLRTACRSEVHALGLWHQTFHCWIVRAAPGGHYLLFQRRGSGKLLFPDKLDITAAGHLLAGETPAAGIRELNEELGVSVRYSELVPLGVTTDIAIEGAVVNREFCHTFLLRRDAPLDQYRLEPGEVLGLAQVRVQDGLRLFGGEAASIVATGLQLDPEGRYQPIELGVTVRDVVPRTRQYYLSIFKMAERLLAGNRDLSI